MMLEEEWSITKYQDKNMAVNEAKFNVEKNSTVSNFQKTSPRLKKSGLVPKGVGDVKSSISLGNSIQRNIAKMYEVHEKTELEHMQVQVKLIQDNRELSIKTEKEISDILKKLNSSTPGPLFNSVKKIAETLSASASTVMGLELMSVGAPILGFIFLSSGFFSGAKLSGLFNEYKDTIENLSIASSIASIASANYVNGAAEISSKAMQSAIGLLIAVTSSGESFSKSKQKGYEAEYQKIRQASEEITHTLENLLREIKNSSEKQAQLSRQIQRQVLANLRVD